jgi:hypothetical protein
MLVLAEAAAHLGHKLPAQYLAQAVTVLSALLALDKS